MIRHGLDSFTVTSADEPKTDPRHAERQCGVKTPAKRTQNHIWSVTKPTEAFSCPTEPDTENRLSWCLASGTLMQRRLRFASHQVVIATHDGAKKIYIIYFQRRRGCGANRTTSVEQTKIEKTSFGRVADSDMGWRWG
jgi:hypothetical protein